MIQISNELKTQLNTSTSIKVRNKIVMGTTEYDSSLIKTYPKISHTNPSVFGGFSSKTCSFEIYNPNNDINFENNEIKVYKGIEVGGNMEWILQGIFIPRAKDIETNITNKTISFNNIQDKAQNFDVLYKSELIWGDNITHSGLEIIQEICDELSIELASNDFNLSTYAFKQPNFAENITCREVINKFSEISGSIAFINREGKLEIKAPTNTNYTIERSRYIKLTKEKTVTFNTLVFGKEGINDDIVYPEEIEGERVEYKILDNPFVDLYREEMIEDISANIIGKSYIPFTLNNFVDGFCLDLNDTISVKDRNGNVLSLTILNYDIVNRISVNIGAEVVNFSNTDYNLSGSNKNVINKIKLDVDHNTQSIKALAEKTDENTTKMSKIELTVEGIEQTVEETVTQVENNTGNIGSLESKVNQNKTETDNNLKDINNKFNNYATTESVTQVTNKVNEITTSNAKLIEFQKTITENGVEKLNTKTGIALDTDGMHIDKDGAKTGSTFDEAGVTIIDKSGTQEELNFYSGYVDDDIVNKFSQLESYKGTSLTYTMNLLVKVFASFPHFRIQETYDETHGQGLGVFHTGGDS